jgi:hypothetical protein
MMHAVAFDDCRRPIRAACNHVAKGKQQTMDMFMYSLRMYGPEAGRRRLAPSYGA